MIKLNYLFLSLIILLFTISCKSDYHSTESIQELEDSLTEKYSKISHVSMYLENSLSMDGYAKGDTDFKNTLVKLLSDLAYIVPNQDSIKVNMINTIIYPYHKNYQEFNKYLTSSGIPTDGDQSNSDINLIFKKILAKTENNEVSILVTDAIYSITGKGCEELIGLLKTESEATKFLFYDRLKSSNLSTLVLKMESNFNGLYYPAKGGSDSINQTRPYYIWFFGDSKLLKTVNDEIKLNELKGYVNDLYVLKTNPIKVDYSILEYGKGKIGEFLNYAMHEYPISTIEFKNKEERSKNIGEFGFAVAVDLSKIPLPESYLKDLNNYTSTSLNYKLYGIESVKSAKIDKKTLKLVDKVENETNAKYTHLIYIKTKEKFIQNFNINIDNKPASWVKDTGLDCDDNIEGDTSKTFGFDKLTNGIIQAYEKVNNTKNYTSITISIKI